MASITCTCGASLEADDGAGLFAVTRAHVDAEHGFLQLSDGDVADFIEASLRMEPPRPTVEAVERIDIRALGPALIDDFLRFMDYEGFRDNAAWANCYCRAPHVGDNAAWQARRGADNREEAVSCIRAGEMRGYLAYDGGLPIAWCNAGPRGSFERFSTRVGEPESDTTTGAVTCFVVAPHVRRLGLARQLLDTAIEGFRAAGMEAVEGYPGTADEGGDAANFRGPRALYLAAGFEPVREVERMTIMRLALGR
jgi:ribosomal protein S18 acetylase RimI-like enzyme